MDGAVLIVSAVEGVQAQTEIIWQALRELGIPTLVYVNKMDRIGADALRVLGRPAAAAVAGRGADCGADRGGGGFCRLGGSAGLGSRWRTTHGRLAIGSSCWRQWRSRTRRCLKPIWKARPLDEAEHLGGACGRRASFDVVSGAVRGFEPRHRRRRSCMDAMLDYMPAPAGSESAPVAGVIFKMERDPVMGKIAYVRLYKARSAIAIPCTTTRGTCRIK